MIISRKSVLSVILGLAFFAPVTVFAQDAEITITDGLAAAVETPFSPSIMVVTDAEGVQSTYTVNDFSLYTSNSPAYDDVAASTSLSLSVGAVVPLDKELLFWSSRTAANPDPTRDLTVTVYQPGENGPEELVYEITDATVISLSASSNTYAEPSVSLSIEAASIVVDGVALN